MLDVAWSAMAASLQGEHAVDVQSALSKAYGPTILPKGASYMHHCGRKSPSYTLGRLRASSASQFGCCSAARVYTFAGQVPLTTAFCPSQTCRASHWLHAAVVGTQTV